MNSLKDFFNRISIAEIISISFLIGVGISVLYKYGFYKTLGIEWYLYSLSPQQIFLSSLSFTVVYILCVASGVVGLVRRSQMGIVLILIPLVLLLLIGGIFGLKPEIYDRFYLLIFVALLSYYFIKFNFFVTDKNDVLIRNKPLEDLTEGERWVPPIASLVIVILMLAVVYVAGYMKAIAFLTNTQEHTLVGLREEKGAWILVENNGDKVLLVKSLKQPVYKIVEVKEIKLYIPNQSHTKPQ